MLAFISVLFLSAPACEREALPWPTRAEIFTWDAEGNKRKPVVLKGRQLDALTRIMRDTASYDREKGAKCFEPQHAVTLYYKTSVLDTFEICFNCHNVEVSGSNPWVGCEPEGNSSLPKHMSFTDDAYDHLKKIFVDAKIRNMPRDKKD